MATTTKADTTDFVPTGQSFHPLLRLRSVVGLGILLFAAYIGSIFLHAPCLLIAIIHPKLFRLVVDSFLYSWLMFAEFIICKIFWTRVRHFGDPIDRSKFPNESSVLILNHPTELDWFFIWPLGRPVHQMKIILKNSLSLIPGAGWAMQCGGFLFLRRRMAVDQKRLQTVISYLLETVNNCQLLMFPEGTNLTAVTLAKSDEYGLKNNLPPTRHTLHPRSTGFVYLVNCLRKANLKYVYDVTVAYPDISPTPSSEFVKGRIPHEVHYYVRRLPVDTLLPSGRLAELTDAQIDELLSDWLKHCWREKEALLADYYAKPMEQRELPNELAPDSAVFHYNLSAPKSCQQTFTLYGLFNTAFWLTFPFIMVYVIFTHLIVFIYFIVAQLIFFYLTYRKDGVALWAASMLGIHNAVLDTTATRFSSSSSSSSSGNGSTTADNTSIDKLTKNK